jgi:hypothetical protein
VLLDYKAFRDSIVSQLKKLNETYTLAGTESSESPQKTLSLELSNTKK